MKQLIVGVVALLVMLAAGPVAAGGWAVTTLDSAPAPAAPGTVEAGETIDIGFTIRQHGVTPVNPDGEVGMVLRSAGGEERFFAAEPAGDVGHYVAEVTFPAEGAWTWAVRQGWFAEQELGPVELAGASDRSTGGAFQLAGWIPLGLPALTLVLGSVTALAGGLLRVLVRQHRTDGREVRVDV